MRAQKKEQNAKMEADGCVPVFVAALAALAPQQKSKRLFGGAGYRSPYLSHAKRALYHLSYTPIDELLATQIRHALNARPTQLSHRGCELLSWLGRLRAGEIAVHTGWTRNTAPPSEPERLHYAAMGGADIAD